MTINDFYLFEKLSILFHFYLEPCEDLDECKSHGTGSIGPDSIWTPLTPGICKLDIRRHGCSEYLLVHNNNKSDDKTLDPDCGLYDTPDFKSRNLCCACGGGSTLEYPLDSGKNTLLDQTIFKFQIIKHQITKQEKMLFNFFRIQFDLSRSSH